MNCVSGGHCEARYPPVAGSQCYQPTNDPVRDMELGCPIIAADGSLTMIREAVFNKQTGKCDCVQGTVKYASRCLTVPSTGGLFGSQPFKGKKINWK